MKQIYLEERIESTPNISGSSMPTPIGRSGLPKYTEIIDYQLKPNISGSTEPVSLGRGGLPKYTKIIDYQK